MKKSSFRLPGCSTLSLHSQATSAFVANPYNTLRAVSMNRYAIWPSFTKDFVGCNKSGPDPTLCQFYFFFGK